MEGGAEHRFGSDVRRLPHAPVFSDGFCMSDPIRRYPGPGARDRLFRPGNSLRKIPRPEGPGLCAIRLSACRKCANRHVKLRSHRPLPEAVPFGSVSGDEGGGGHGALAIGLDGCEPEGFGAGGDGEVGADLAGCGILQCWNDLGGRVDFDPLLSVEGGEGAGPRVVGADLAFELGGGPRPIELAIGAHELALVGDLFGILGRAGQGSCRETGEGVVQRIGGDVGEPVVQAAAGLVRGEGRGVRQDGVAGVEPPGRRA